MNKYLVRDFAPDKIHSRHSEGAFFKLDNGDIAFVYSLYGSDCWDNAACNLAISYSHDNGNSFSDPEIILTAKECNGENIMSVSLLEMQDGKIGIFYLKKTADNNCRMFMRKTSNFKSFSDETLCTSGSGWFVVNNDRVVRLKNGRIIIPSACSETDEGCQAIAKFFASDDDGKSFYLLSETKAPQSYIRTGFQEPGIIELDDNIVAFFRNDSGRQYIAYSNDNCETWSKPEPSRFTSPVSPMSIKQLKDKTIVAVYNPIPYYWGCNDNPGVWTGMRSPLLLSICENTIDDEKKEIVLENDDKKGFCYTAIYQIDNDILLAYNAGGKEDGLILGRLRIIKIPVSDLKNTHC